MFIKTNKEVALVVMLGFPEIGVGSRHIVLAYFEHNYLVQKSAGIILLLIIIINLFLYSAVSILSSKRFT